MKRTALIVVLGITDSNAYCEERKRKGESRVL